MKKLLYIIALLFSAILFQSCESDIDSPVLTEDEYPRILGRWPDKMKDDSGNIKLGTFEVVVGQPLSIVMQFTPSNLCEGTWYLDDVEYSKGTTFEFVSETPVSHNLKLVVKTPKYTTSREANLIVSPAP